MRYFVTGASGLLGAGLIERLRADGHEVRALSRRPRAGGGTQGVEWVTGDPAVAGPWQESLSGCDGVVHLAGEPIAARRWTTAQKQRLIDSRVESTRLIARTIREASPAPSVLVNASAVGVYGSRGEEILDENSPPGDDFLARLSLAWEEATGAASEGSATRVVLMRIGIVLDPDGGALQKLLPPFRLGLGGPLGPSDRWFPWVQLEDAVGLIRFALEAPLEGPVNVVAPGSVRMGEFARTLGRVLGRPALLPVPIAPLRIVLGEFAGYLSPGQRIRPNRALEAGYVFAHPELEGALRRCLEPRGASAPAKG